MLIGRSGRCSNASHSCHHPRRQDQSAHRQCRGHSQLPQDICARDGEDGLHSAIQSWRCLPQIRKSLVLAQHSQCQINNPTQYQYFSMYVEYVNNYNKSSELLDKLRKKNKAWAQFEEVSDEHLKQTQEPTFHKRKCKTPPNSVWRILTRCWLSRFNAWLNTAYCWMKSRNTRRKHIPIMKAFKSRGRKWRWWLITLIKLKGRQNNWHEQLKLKTYSLITTDL